MPRGLQTLVALLVLLPGFVSARIVRSLSAQSQQSDLERIVEALIFSFFNYVIYIVIFGTSLPIEWLPSFQVHRWRVVFLAVSASVLGLFWGDQLVAIPGRGIWLTDKAEIEYVMFLDREAIPHEERKS